MPSTGTTPAPVQAPAGFNTPSGYGVVSVGPGGIPTLRASGAANQAGQAGGQGLPPLLQNLFHPGGNGGGFNPLKPTTWKTPGGRTPQQVLADLLMRD